MIEPSPEPGAVAGGEEGVGCRPAALAGLALVAWAVVVGGIGLTMALNETCQAVCAEGGLALFYSAAPVSALFGVLGGGLPVAWPLDVFVWIMAGVVLVSLTTRRRIPLGRAVAAVVGLALVFGFVMSRFVEVDRLA